MKKIKCEICDTEKILIDDDGNFVEAPGDWMFIDGKWYCKSCYNWLVYGRAAQ